MNVIKTTDSCGYGGRIRHGISTLVGPLFFICALMLLGACANTFATRRLERVLFVGNSVMYVNNLPAIFELIASKQPGAPDYYVDMLAHGGATLTDHLQNSQLVDLIESGRYDVIVLQERGGDDLCVLSSEDRETENCEGLYASHIRLAELAREHGARVVYLGTYQFSSQASRALVRAERGLSMQMAAQYVEVSERLQSLRESHAQLPWLYVDQGHPGIATTALMAVRIYEKLNGRAALPFELCTSAEMYPPSWKHDSIINHAEIVAEFRPVRCLLSQTQMTTITRGSVGAGSTSGVVDGP